MQVQFFFLSRSITLKQRAALKKFIAGIFPKYNKRLGQLNYIFCSDEYLLKINNTHLKHNYYTDIITFDLSPDARLIEGEIYISIDRVRDNAKELKTFINEELHRVIFHGALHLCGYKDKNAAEKKEMRAAENELLLKYFKK